MLKLQGTVTRRFDIAADTRYHFQFTSPVQTRGKAAQELREVRILAVSDAQLYAAVSPLEAPRGTTPDDGWPVSAGYETEYLIPSNSVLTVFSIHDGNIWFRLQRGTEVELVKE